MPALHPQQVPVAVRKPDAGFECAHFQLDGPAPGDVSTGGARRWTLAAGVHVPDRASRTRSGLLGPWEVPDIGDCPPGVNPGGVDPWGIDNFQIFPNLEILIYRGWYLLYRYWPTSHNTHRFEGIAVLPARRRTVRERVEHEVAAVVFKEFALQDAGMLKRHADRHWSPACSTSSRSATRRSWSGTSTEGRPTGSRRTSANAAGGAR